MNRSRALIALLLAFALLAVAVSPAFAATQAELEKHQKAAESARKRAAAAESTAKKLSEEVAGLDKEIERYEAAAAALDPQIDEATARGAEIQRDVDHLTSEVEATQREIAQTQAEYAQQQDLLRERVSSTYRQGSWFYLDVLLGSRDITDFITRTEFVSRVIESNNDIAYTLEATEADLTRAKVKLDRSLETVTIKRKEAAKVESDLREMQAAREQQANEREALQQQKSSLVAENKANAKRLLQLAEQEEAESAKIAAELGGSGSGVYGGVMAWPVPSSHRITSNFGWRVHPIFGSRRFHSGLDIGAPQGSSIVAAGSGKVIYAAYRGGYGNTLMIDHGNGVVTLYAHQMSGGFKVGVGARVTRGQAIGAVGSTGNSTGPHLHFEVRVNGVPKNPLGYL